MNFKQKNVLESWLISCFVKYLLKKGLLISQKYGCDFGCFYDSRKRRTKVKSCFWTKNEGGEKICKNSKNL